MQSPGEAVGVGALMGRSFGAEVGAEQQRRSEMASGARRVCIVGGAGYVGSCLSRALAADGVEEIRLFDRTFPDEPEFQLQFPHQAIQIKVSSFFAAWHDPPRPPVTDFFSMNVSFKFAEYCSSHIDD